MFKWLTDLFYNWGGGPSKTEQALQRANTMWILVMMFVIVLGFTCFKMYRDVQKTKTLNEKTRRIKELEEEKIKYESKKTLEIVQKEKDQEFEELRKTLTALTKALVKDE